MRFLRLASERALRLALTAAADQPRVPAGSSKGGQFGKKAGGSGGSGITTLSSMNAPSAGGSVSTGTINPMTAPRAAIVAHLRATGFKGSVSVSVPALRQMAANHIAARGGIAPPPPMPGAHTPAIPRTPHTPPRLPAPTMSSDQPGKYAGQDYATAHANIARLHVTEQVALIHNSGHSLSANEVTAWQQQLHQAKVDLAASPAGSWQTRQLANRVTHLEGQMSRSAALAVVSKNTDWTKITRNDVLKLSAQTGVALARRSGSVPHLRADLQANIAGQVGTVKVHYADAVRRASHEAQAAAAAKSAAASLAAMQARRSANHLAHPELSKMLDPTAVSRTHPPAAYAGRSSVVIEVANAYRSLGYDHAQVHDRVASVSALNARDDIAIVVYRGVSDGYHRPHAGSMQGTRIPASDIVAHFGDGTRDHYVGDGIYGQGTYTSPHMRTATGYAPGGRVMAMGIRKDANIVRFSEVKAFQRANPGLQATDVGTVALMMGADVMHVDDGTDHHVVYNRAAVVFVQPDANGMFTP